MPSFERAKRGLRAILGIAHPDDAWAKARLRPKEYQAYARLDPRDREHSVLVAKELLRRFPDAPPEAVRAALLHDVGKALRRYRALERILTALLEPWLPNLPPEPLERGWRGAVQVRLHHERYAAEMLEDPKVRGILAAFQGGGEEEAARWARHIRAIDDLY